MQSFINQFAFYLFLITYIGGIILYNIIGFIAIENVADASFFGNKGTFLAIFLGYIFSNLLTDSEPKTKSVDVIKR